MSKGKLMNIDIEKFKEQFDKEYQFLYDNYDRVAGYGEALDAMEAFIVEHGEFVGEFARYRGDYITSDREMVAFMFALNEMIEDTEEE